MKSAELVPGTRYAYRKAPGRPGTPLERVRYLGDPPAGGRVGVAFETGERTGQEGNATLGQLAAPWEEAESIEVEEASLEELIRVVPPHLAGQLTAVELMLWVNAGVDEIEPVAGGVILPADAARELAERAELDPRELTAPPSFVARDGRVVLALAAAHALAKALAKQEPVATLEWIEEWESVGGGYLEHYRPAFAQIKRWTGVTSEELQLARVGAAEQQRLRRGLLEVRESLQAIEGEVHRLRGRIDELLEVKADDHRS